MSIVKTEAIILRSRKQGETSKILTALTAHYGKLSLMAKGSRSSKSRFPGTLELFNHIRIVFYKKENRDIQYISQAEIIQHFPGIHGQLGKMSLAAILCELVEKTEETGHRNPQLFQWLADALCSLERSESGLKNIIRVSLLKFLRLSGFEPALSSCYACGNANLEDWHDFDLQHGVYFCAACASTVEGGLKLTGNAMKSLRWLNRISLNQVLNARLSSAAARQVDDFIKQYFIYHVEGFRLLKSWDHLEKLERNLRSLT
jgi:DNA repair protein RecO (recombination protein O)